MVGFPFILLYVFVLPTGWLTLHLGEKQHLNLVYPAYRLNSLCGWEDDVRKVFSCGLGRFNPFHAHDLGLEWELDPNTSLRIYIEDQTNPEDGFPFHTVRNLAMILLLFGPKIDSMINSKILEEIAIEHGEEWLGPKPLPDIYSQLPKQGNVQTPREMASYILHNCSTIESICEEMEKFLSTLRPEFKRHFSVDFFGLVSNSPKRSNESTYQTRESTPETTQLYYADQIRKERGPNIEFIHHPGTLDADHIVHWIRFLSSLVEFAGHIGLESLILFLGLEENGYQYTYSSSTKDVDSTDSEPDEPDGYKPPPASTVEQRLRTWDQVGWHPTLAQHEKTDPPNYAADAAFQHTYPIGALITAMDVSGIGLELDTSEFWMKALDVKYKPDLKPSPEESELPLMGMESVESEECEDELELVDTEAMEKDMSVETGKWPAERGDTSETEWLPRTSSLSESTTEDEVWRGKRRKYK
jgi:hypothetical protein